MDFIKEFVVLNGNKIDKAASIKNFEKQLDVFELLTETNQARIASAVDSVFNKWRQKPIRKEALLSFSLNELCVTIDNYESIHKAVEIFIRSNTGARGKAIFGIRPGAGFIRWCDWSE